MMLVYLFFAVQNHNSLNPKCNRIWNGSKHLNNQQKKSLSKNCQVSKWPLKLFISTELTEKKNNFRIEIQNVWLHSLYCVFVSARVYVTPSVVSCRRWNQPKVKRSENVFKAIFFNRFAHKVNVVVTLSHIWTDSIWIWKSCELDYYKILRTITLASCYCKECDYKLNNSIELNQSYQSKTGRKRKIWKCKMKIIC